MAEDHPTRYVTNGDKFVTWHQLVGVAVALLGVTVSIFIYQSNNTVSQREFLLANQYREQSIAELKDSMVNLRQDMRELRTLMEKWFNRPTSAQRGGP